MEQKDALQRIGRNLANFQTLEHLLKELIPTLSMRGTVAEMQQALEHSKKRIKKASLGDLSEAFHSSVYAQPAELNAQENLKEPVFSFAIHIDTTTERIRATKLQWRKLVVQRNRLVHSQLMAYDFDKPEDCNKLCSVLDEQNFQICSMLDELTLLRAHRSRVAAAMVEQLEAGNHFKPDSQTPDDA